MASEAAILGTPAIYINTLSLGYLEELERIYGLVQNCVDDVDTIEAIDRIFERDNPSDKWRCQREQLLSDKVDVTLFISEQVDKFFPNIV
jgi:predicted glycosyltransferase